MRKTLPGFSRPDNDPCCALLFRALLFCAVLCFAVPCCAAVRCRIYIYDGNTNRQIGVDSMNANAVTSPVTYTASAKPGQKVTLK
jgi:hypothetical protein